MSVLADRSFVFIHAIEGQHQIFQDMFQCLSQSLHTLIRSKR